MSVGSASLFPLSGGFGGLGTSVVRMEYFTFIGLVLFFSAAIFPVKFVELESAFDFMLAMSPITSCKAFLSSMAWLNLVIASIHRSILEVAAVISLERLRISSICRGWKEGVD